VENHLDNPVNTEECYQRLVPAMEAVYGATNPAILTALTGYAETLKRLGRTEEVGKIQRRAESIRQASQQK
jgi:hypothetical protein